MFILFFSICANIIIIRAYLRNKKNESYKSSSIIYSVILMVVLVILLYTTYIEWRNSK